MTRSMRDADCPVFDGWVSPSDFRPGVQVWGNHALWKKFTGTDAPDCVLAFCDVETERALVCRARSVEGQTESHLATISVKPNVTWHYHKGES
ncbi:MAG TPA: hypothetical protein VIV09_14630 [Pseudolabrys sp.]